MRVLVFDLIGKMAHFRKFYTNSSSLSYYFPPRTTLAGILAALLGLERDSYYEQFDESAFISLEIKTSLRKKVNVVNYLFVKSPADITGKEGGTQVPLEFVLPVRGVENIVYRVFFSHEDKNIYNLLKSTLENRIYKFPIYLGITELLARYSYVGEYEAEKITNHEGEITSVINTDYLEPETKLITLENIFIDRIPASFENGRKLKRVSNYLFRPDGGKIKVYAKEMYEIKELESLVIPM